MCCAGPFIWKKWLARPSPKLSELLVLLDFSRETPWNLWPTIGQRLRKDLRRAAQSELRVVLAIGHFPLEQSLSITTCSRHEYMIYQATLINNDLFVQPPLPLIQQFKSLLSLHHLQSSTQPHTLYKAVLSVLHSKIQNTNPSAS